MMMTILLFLYRATLYLCICCCSHSCCFTWGFVTRSAATSRAPRRTPHTNDLRGQSWTAPLVGYPPLLFSRRRDQQDDHNDDDDYLDDDDDDDDDDDEPPDVDISNFKAPTAAFGLHTGRSSPATRKGMGLARSSTATVFLCTSCGSEFVKWMGRCPTCKNWNCLQEHVVTRQANSDGGGGGAYPWFGGSSNGSNNNDAVIMNHHPATSWLAANDEQRTPTRLSDIFRQNDNKSRQRRRQRIEVPNDEELNNVLGGGFFPGSLILVGGSPGVGKSTLLLQTAASLAATATPRLGIGMGPGMPKDDNEMIGPVWYVSGEETPTQIASRASRLNLLDDETTSNQLYVWQETHADRLCQQVVQALQQAPRHLQPQEDDDSSTTAAAAADPPSLLIIDSIQTMVCNAGGASAAGGITQVRECVGLFLRLAKSTGIPVVLVGHVTKSGDVAGPRTVEHMVDCVLYLEGSTEGGLHQIRVLRANKNRFGSTDEVGVYEMTAGRLQPVSDPSSLFMAHRSLMMQDVEGCAVSVALEGRRAVTLEVQALVTVGTEKFSRKTVDGIPVSRLQLLVGVLQKRCKMFFSRQDIYLNVVAGQMRLDRKEANAADLAVAVALVSSLTQIPVRADTAFCGEVGLLGELRTVVSLAKRVKEAKRMGFSRVITARDGGGGPRSKKNQKTHTSNALGIEWVQCETLIDALNLALVSPIPKRTPRKKTRSSEQLSIPGSMDELGLDEIMDDEDDEDSFL